MNFSLDDSTTRGSSDKSGKKSKKGKDRPRAIVIKGGTGLMSTNVGAKAPMYHEPRPPPPLPREEGGVESRSLGERMWTVDSIKARDNGRVRVVKRVDRRGNGIYRTPENVKEMI